MADSDADVGDGGSDRLRIGFVRSGGFGGMRLATELDAAELTPDEARVLRSLLAVGAADDPGAASGPARGADHFRYDLTIQDGATSRTLSLSESDLTPELRPLVQRLEAHARNRP